MAWSVKGNKALAILKVVELNGQWQSLWFPDEQPLQAAAQAPKNLQEELFGQNHAYILGISIPRRDQSLEHLRLLLCEVAGLSRIVHDVVEFPFA